MKTVVCLYMTALMTASSLYAGAPDDIDVDAILGKMTLPQKIGQMMIIGYEGRRVTPDAMARLQEDTLGGFFFQPISNFNFPDELARLVADLQSAALASPIGIPLFVCMDAEGGAAAPIHYMLGATPTPGNMALGASGREEDAYAAYNALGSDLRTCGANVNFAPVVDVLKSPKNPDYTIRAFGGDSKRNAVLGRGAVRGLQDAGVIPCPKHFPGLVYEEEDSHRAISHIALPESTLMEDGLAHFQAPIDAGADMIMTHHAIFDAWDPDYPVTLSAKVITGVLRQHLNFKNLVVTDSMGMGGIAREYGLAESTVLAVLAGCDLVLQVSRDVPEVKERIAAVADAVRKGRIAERQVDDAVRKILKTKAKYNLFTNAKPDVDKVYSLLARPNAVAANKQAALNGIVVVRDEDHLLPLPVEGKKICVVCPPSVVTRAGKGGEGAGESLPVGYPFGRYIRALVPGADEARVDTVPSEAEMRHARNKASAADILIVTSLLAMQSPKQVQFIKDLIALGKPTVVVGLGDPSDLTQFMEARTFVAANSPAPISLGAAAHVLFGKATAGGTLPMPIGDVYPIGHALARTSQKE